MGKSKRSPVDPERKQEGCGAALVGKSLSIEHKPIAAVFGVVAHCTFIMYRKIQPVLEKPI